MIRSLALLYQQRAGFLTESSSSAAAFPEAKLPVTGDVRQGSGLPYHSDEIARDSHPLPFYPPGQRTSPRRQAPAVFYSDERKYSTPHLKKQYLSSPAASSRPSPAPQASGRGRLSAGHRRQHSSPASGGSSRRGRSRRRSCSSPAPEDRRGRHGTPRHGGTPRPIWPPGRPTASRWRPAWRCAPV